MHRPLRRNVVKVFMVVSVFASSLEGTTNDPIEESRIRLVDLRKNLENGTDPTPQVLHDLRREFDAIATAQIPDSFAFFDQSAPLTRNLDSLYTRVEQLAARRAEKDTLLAAIVELTKGFTRRFARHFYALGMASQKTKLLLFSTSMSCECTMKMCAEQEAALRTLEATHPESPFVIIIDAFEHFDLQRKHGVRVLPTLLLLDGGNAELLRMEREEFDLDRISRAKR